MKKFTLGLYMLSVFVMLLGLSSCRGGKVNGAIALAASKTVRQFISSENSDIESNLSFRGKCNHVDKKIPWNECDKCGLHKVYW